MTITAEPTVQKLGPMLVASGEPDHPGAPSPISESTSQRQVVVAVDACCEIDPATAQTYGMLILPRAARVDGTVQQLETQRTLHHSCWSHPPRRIAAEPYTLGDLSLAYGQVLHAGLNVLALLPLASLDPLARTAAAARSILLAGQSAADGHTARIAIYELAAVGLRFTFLVEAAALAAAEGLSLPQVITFLERLQGSVRSYYLTGLISPIQPLRSNVRAEGVARFGREQLWELDPITRQFVCRARGQVAATLFAPTGPLHGLDVTVQVYRSRLLARVNAGRTALELPPLEAQPGGVSLMQPFPAGCVELAVLPDSAHLAYILDVIRRIDRPASLRMSGVAARGGI